MSTMSPTKSPCSWTSNAGQMVFVVPSGPSRAVKATSIDHPKTICKVMDMLRDLTPHERALVISMSIELEMHLRKKEAT